MTYDECRKEAIEWLGNDIGNKLKLSDHTIWNRVKLEDELQFNMKDIPVINGEEPIVYYDRELYYFYMELARQQYLIGKDD